MFGAASAEVMRATAKASLDSIEWDRLRLEAKKAWREKILEKTPEAERWRVLALWEAADSVPACRHYSNSVTYRNSGSDSGFGFGLFGLFGIF